MMELPLDRELTLKSFSLEQKEERLIPPSVSLYALILVTVIYFASEITNWFGLTTLPDKWLSFWGTIIGNFIGGSATVVGVFLAFRFQQLASRKKEHARISNIFSDYLLKVATCNQLIGDIQRYLKNKEEFSKIERSLNNFDPLKTVNEVKNNMAYLMSHSYMLTSTMTIFFDITEKHWDDIKQLTLEAPKGEVEFNKLLRKIHEVGTEFHLAAHLVAMSVWHVNTE